jgi:hypothetical protein
MHDKEVILNVDLNFEGIMKLYQHRQGATCSELKKSEDGAKSKSWSQLDTYKIWSVIYWGVIRKIAWSCNDSLNLW